MRKTVALLLIICVLIASSGCSMQNSDAWKENTGFIDLGAMEVTGEGAVIEGKNVNITAGGDYEVKGELSGGMIYVETDDSVRLRLSGVNIINSSGPAIYFSNVEKAYVTVTEETENYIEDGSEYSVEGANATLFSNDDLEINGSGVLKIVANYKHGIASDDDMTLDSGNIVVNSNEHGIKVNNKLHITGGDATIYSVAGKGIKAEQELVVDAGNISIMSYDEGIESKGTLIINGGNINIESAEDGINTGSSDTTTDETQQTSAETGKVPPQQNGTQPRHAPVGIEPGRTEGGMPPAGENGSAERPQMPEGEMPRGMKDGDFAGIDDETAEAHSITINGGRIFIKAEGDGIDSNGHLTVNSGVVIIDGPSERDNGSLDCDGTMSITGGTVFALSGGGMMQLPRGENNQHVIAINVGYQSKDSVVAVTDAQGAQIISHTALRDFTSIVISDSKLDADAEYFVYINGEKIQPVTPNGVGAPGGGMPRRPGAGKTPADG